MHVLRRFTKILVLIFVICFSVLSSETDDDETPIDTEMILIWTQNAKIPIEYIFF